MTSHRFDLIKTSQRNHHKNTLFNSVVVPPYNNYRFLNKDVVYGFPFYFSIYLFSTAALSTFAIENSEKKREQLKIPINNWCNILPKEKIKTKKVGRSSQKIIGL